MKLVLMAEPLAICRLEANAPWPEWAKGEGLVALIRDAEELSVICPERHLPKAQAAVTGWRALRVSGPLDFSLVGVMATLTTPLAQAGVSLLAVSTYSTDYLLVREGDLARALEALLRAGHQVSV
jgi:hypothetical protein